MKLRLNMIVKNEVARIERCLESVAPWISSWVILDTGSSDGTQIKIINFFERVGIPGHLEVGRFDNFAQARNDALVAARAFSGDYDYLLLCDADMELVVADHTAFDKLAGPSCDMQQRAGTIFYSNRRFLRSNQPGQYVTPTHEYLDVEPGYAVPANEAYFLDHADGQNRPGKAKRDIKMLKDGLRKDPKNARCMFYLAQSYKDDGDFERSIKWYDRRIAAGGWDEELFMSQFSKAMCYRSLGKEAKFIHEMLIAHNMRQHRAEPLYVLANHFRMKPDMQQLGAEFALLGFPNQTSGDLLFVDVNAHNFGCKEEFAICAYYTPMKAAGFVTANELSLNKAAPVQVRETAKQNLFYYASLLKEVAPSFEWKQVSIPLDEHWTAMNPSIWNHKDRLYAIIRTVNYRMDEHGRYLIRSVADGSITNANPINTRNFITALNDDLTVINSKEITPPEMPCGFPLVIGNEDMRLFSVDNQFYASSTVRQIAPDGNCEQVLTPIDENSRCTSYWRMLREPRVTEKNWMPIEGDEVRFVYHLGHIVDKYGQDLITTKVNLDIEPLRGGSQAIRAFDGYICLVHEARQQPGSHLRCYMHRFVWFSKDYRDWRATLPFFFNDKVIEFAAGIARHPSKDEFVISYGFKDKEARFGSISTADVAKLLGLPYDQSQGRHGLRADPGSSADGCSIRGMGRELQEAV